MKKCSRCQVQKPLSDFYSNGSQGYCKTCACQYKRDNYDGAKRKRREVKLQYNLEWDQYEEMASRGCAICGRMDKLVIDHDHRCCPERKRSCGKCIRGLLCSNHNVLLGMAEDDPAILYAAVRYLEGTLYAPGE